MAVFGEFRGLPGAGKDPASMMRRADRRCSQMGFTMNANGRSNVEPDVAYNMPIDFPSRLTWRRSNVDYAEGASSPASAGAVDTGLSLRLPKRAATALA